VFLLRHELLFDVTVTSDPSLNTLTVVIAVGFARRPTRTACTSTIGFPATLPILRNFAYGRSWYCGRSRCAGHDGSGGGCGCGCSGGCSRRRGRRTASIPNSRARDRISGCLLGFRGVNVESNARLCSSVGARERNER